MGYEILSAENEVQPYGINFCINNCPTVNIKCGGNNKPSDSFCNNPGLGCRNGCGGATGSSCVGTQSI